MAQFVVLEGLDGAGTTTQRQRLAARLEGQGQQVLVTHEPTDLPVGRLIRRVLQADPEAPGVEALPWLFAADRKDHLMRRVDPFLAQGGWVISDRYYHSSLAYQSLTLPLKTVWALNASFRVPDLTIFVEVGVDVALERIQRRNEAREVYERRDALEAIHSAYERVMDHCEALGHRVVRVSGEASIEAVEDAIWRAVQR